MHEHEEWLNFAEYDLKAAQLLINSFEPIIPPALVLAQQAAEKALKSYLLYQNDRFVRIHDLIKLTALCKRFDQEFENILEDAAALNPHISASRYPDSCFVIPDFSTAQVLVGKADRIYNFVKSKLVDKQYLY
jgi:HEPN domain-containing protein